MKQVLTHWHQPNNQSTPAKVKSTSTRNVKRLVDSEIEQSSHSTDKINERALEPCTVAMPTYTLDPIIASKMLGIQ